MSHIHQFQYTGTEYPVYKKLSNYNVSDDQPELEDIQTIIEMRCNGCGEMKYKNTQGNLVKIGLDFVITHGYFAVMLKRL